MRGMQRLMLAVCVLAGGMGLAQGVVTVLPAAAPVVSVLPQPGIVTITASYGQFYTNLGAKERLCAGAELLVVRRGVAVGRARVLKVNMLDSIAQLLPEYAVLIPQAGDQVVVTANPVRPTVGRLRPPMMLGTPGRDCRPPELPAIEPDMEFDDLEPFYTLAVVAALVLIVVD